MTKKDKQKKIKALLDRFAQWEDLYPSDYTDRFFVLYGGELRAIIDALSKRK